MYKMGSCERKFSMRWGGNGMNTKVRGLLSLAQHEQKDSYRVYSQYMKEFRNIGLSHKEFDQAQRKLIAILEV